MSRCVGVVCVVCVCVCVRLPVTFLIECLHLHYRNISSCNGKINFEASWLRYLPSLQVLWVTAVVCVLNFQLTTIMSHSFSHPLAHLTQQPLFDALTNPVSIKDSLIFLEKSANKVSNLSFHAMRFLWNKCVCFTKNRNEPIRWSIQSSMSTRCVVWLLGASFDWMQPFHENCTVCT